MDPGRVKLFIEYHGVLCTILGTGDTAMGEGGKKGKKCLPLTDLSFSSSLDDKDRETSANI